MTVRKQPGLADATGGRILFGGDYNPEQWPQETWQEDVRLMRDAGVNSVTLGVFSWSRLEPRPGAREFGWLDRLMDLMHDNGIGVVLATPTASPPPWMGRLHPDTLPVDQDGRTEWWGGRQHFSHSSATYRHHAAAITEDLAVRYGGHPALTLWHINNEYCTDLTGYKLVVVPQLYALTDAAIDNLLAYLDGGGTLVCGFLTGVADEDDRVRPGGMDARLRDLLGIRTLHEWWPLDAGEYVECHGFRGTLWSEEIEKAQAGEVEAAYQGGELDGLPAVLRRGRAWYVSTLPEPAALRALLARISAGAGARPVLDGLPETVEAVRRGDLLFVLNHGREPVTVEVPGTHTDLLTGATVRDTVTLGRYGVAVLRP